MNVPFTLICSQCDGGATADSERRACVCTPTPNRVLSYALQTLSGAMFRASLRGTDLWRYESLLPVARTYASALRVGGSPLLDLGAALDGVQLYVKDETRNPSGSLKDRATEVALAVARSQGHDEVIAASTGNAGASLARLAAAHGMRAKVVLPASAPRGKLAQITAFGAELIIVDGSYDDAFDRAQEYAAHTGVCCRSTGVNPYTREGKKTCAFEIAEQLDWEAPDWVIVPCGDGNILSGIEAGFHQMELLGCSKRSPRLVAAQAASSNSIQLTHAIAKTRGTIPRFPVPVAPRTIANSIAVERPRDHVSAVRALLRSEGLAVTVDDGEIRFARRELARRFGLLVEPSAAAAYAVATRLRAGRTIADDDSCVLLLTGAGVPEEFL
jgi:threonine synthase